MSKFKRLIMRFTASPLSVGTFPAMTKRCRRALPSPMGRGAGDEGRMLEVSCNMIKSLRSREVENFISLARHQALIPTLLPNGEMGGPVGVGSPS